MLDNNEVNEELADNKKATEKVKIYIKNILDRALDLDTSDVNNERKIIGFCGSELLDDEYNSIINSPHRKKIIISAFGNISESDKNHILDKMCHKTLITYQYLLDEISYMPSIGDSLLNLIIGFELGSFLVKKLNEAEKV